jgi:hypothetical protein
MALPMKAHTNIKENVTWDDVEIFGWHLFSQKNQYIYEIGKIQLRK